MKNLFLLIPKKAWNARWVWQNINQSTPSNVPVLPSSPQQTVQINAAKAQTSTALYKLNKQIIVDYAVERGTAGETIGQTLKREAKNVVKKHNKPATGMHKGFDSMLGSVNKLVRDTRPKIVDILEISEEEWEKASDKEALLTSRINTIDFSTINIATIAKDDYDAQLSVLDNIPRWAQNSKWEKGYLKFRKAGGKADFEEWDSEIRESDGSDGIAGLFRELSAGFVTSHASTDGIIARFFRKLSAWWKDLGLFGKGSVPEKSDLYKKIEAKKEKKDAKTAEEKAIQKKVNADKRVINAQEKINKKQEDLDNAEEALVKARRPLENFAKFNGDEFAGWKEDLVDENGELDSENSEELRSLLEKYKRALKTRNEAREKLGTAAGDLEKTRNIVSGEIKNREKNEDDKKEEIENRGDFSKIVDKANTETINGHGRSERKIFEDTTVDSLKKSVSGVEIPNFLTKNVKAIQALLSFVEQGKKIDDFFKEPLKFDASQLKLFSDAVEKKEFRTGTWAFEVSDGKLEANRSTNWWKSDREFENSVEFFEWLK